MAPGRKNSFNNRINSHCSVGRTKNRAVALFVAGLALSLVATGCGDKEDAADANLSPEMKSAKRYVADNCLGCHTVNGASSSGPTLKGLAGSQVKLKDGTTVTADDAYLTEAIVDPNAKIVAGYGNSMASAFPKGSVSADQARQIVAYMQTLK